jgi:hypothetical protein
MRADISQIRSAYRARIIRLDHPSHQNPHDTSKFATIRRDRRECMRSRDVVPPPRFQRLRIILREGSAHAAVPAVPILRCQRGSPSAPRAGLQARQLHAQAGAGPRERSRVPGKFAEKLIYMRYGVGCKLKQHAKKRGVRIWSLSSFPATVRSMETNSRGWLVRTRRAIYRCPGRPMERSWPTTAGKSGEYRIQHHSGKLLIEDVARP